jgi:hypothetical protein
MNEFYEYEIRCKRCRNLTPLAIQKCNATPIEFIEFCLKKLEFDTLEECQKCEKITRHELISYTNPYK